MITTTTSSFVLRICSVFFVLGGLCFAEKSPLQKAPKALADVQIENEGLTVLYGNALVEKLQEEGSFEAYLQAGLMGKKVQVRSMAYSGDQVNFRIRPSRFGKHMAYLVDQWTADRVVMAFGGNEAYAGPEGLEAFKQQLEDYLDLIKGRHENAELVLVSPIAAERVSRLIQDGLEERKENLRLYTAAMKEVTEAKGVSFVDLLEPTSGLFAETNGVYTYDGIHLNAKGADVVGKLLAEALEGQGAVAKIDAKAEGFQALKKLVSRKASEVSQAYHPTNGISYYGQRGRTYEYFSEIPHHLKLANTLDEAIWKQAADLTVAQEIPELEVFRLETQSNNPRRGLGIIKTAEEDLKDFTMAEGFEVKCFASSEDFPELINPLQMQFDAQGRLWVISNASYPHPLPGMQANDRVLIYEDTDGDGKADQQTVFAEGLSLPEGLVFYKKGLIVSVNHKVLYLEDRNGDSVADYQEEIIRGTDNTDTHHSGYLARTPRGDLMISEALFHRGQFEAANGVTHTRDSAMMSFDLDTRYLTVERQTEAPNPWRITYNQYGEAIHFYGGGQIIDADLYNIWTPMGIVEPGRIGEPFRYDKGCSAQFVESPHFPKEWQGGLLTAHLLSTNEVNYTPMKYVDGAYRSSGKKLTIIKSSNKVFRPTDIVFGLDGSLYISDFYYPIIGHAQHSNRDKNRINASGRIWRVTKKDAPLLEAPQIAGASVKELLGLLKNPLLKVRQLARLELETHPKATVITELNEMKKSVASDDPLALEILWLLERFKEFGDTAFYKSLLSSTNLDVQKSAVRSFRWWAAALGSEGPDVAKQLTGHEDERLKILLVGALSHLQRTDEKWTPILEMIQSKSRTPLEMALTMASWKDKPSIAPEFPLLKVSNEAMIQEDLWMGKEPEVEGVLYFKSEVDGEFVLGHEGNPYLNLSANDTPLLIASGSKHTKSSQNNFKVKKGINKLGYSFFSNGGKGGKGGKAKKSKDSNKSDKGYSSVKAYLADKAGGAPKGLSLPNNKKVHQEWATQYEAEMQKNWKEFAVHTFKQNCANCHSIDQKAVGPPLRGLLGKTQLVSFADGTKKEVTIDEAYLRQSIVDPTAVYPEGYHPVMLKLPLSDKEVDVLVKWLESLK